MQFLQVVLLFQKVHNHFFFLLFSYILINGFDGEVTIASGSSTELLGEILLTRFIFPFELVSFVLLAALIGGITLARKDEALIDKDQV